MGSAMSVTAIVGPVFMTQLFAWFTGPQAPVYFPGVSFLAAAALTIGAWSVFASVVREAEPAAVARDEV